ncbi:hypothetical protein AAFF_G00147560 [Aldrovandia affinis]|uniref:Reverse transcriptase/retrotransposon-derived protein RNase H-like domain-containing protein n=1 Tax=Aldrovandia affinis TaxID=143900 RepID=A0AAD7RPL2_9TELE|nr:hypothetical protein AAFF_G00147560 [Aldrovandia affinis]
MWRVLRRVAVADLKLHPEKCHFMRREVVFLGHKVGEEGIGTMGDKVQAVRDWTTPTTGDASNVGMDGVLAQMGPEGERVLAYFSRTFNKAERRYCVTRRELFAMLLAICVACPSLYGLTTLLSSGSCRSKRQRGRKPRINSQLVAQQVAQQYSTPPPLKKEKKEKPERPGKERVDTETTEQVRPEEEGKQPDKDKPDREKDISHTAMKEPNSKNTKPKLKNIDRSTAQQLAITVGNVTVIITDFKEKTRTSSMSSSTVTSSTGSEQQHQSSGSESMDKGSSRASTPKGDLSLGHDESF